MKYAPREVERYLPKSNLISIHWRWWWFKRIGSGYRFFSTMRIANALCIWLGPLDITIRQRYLFGPARQLHPEAFAMAGREDLL